MPIGVVVDAFNERVLETNEAHLLRHPTQLKSCVDICLQLFEIVCNCLKLIEIV